MGKRIGQEKVGNEWVQEFGTRGFMSKPRDERNIMGVWKYYLRCHGLENEMAC